MSWPLPNLSTSAGYPTGSQLFRILIPFLMLAFTKKPPAMCWDDLLLTDTEKKGFWPLPPDISSSQPYQEDDLLYYGGYMCEIIGVASQQFPFSGIKPSKPNS